MPHLRTQVRGQILAALQTMPTPGAVYDERRLRIDPALRPLVVLSLGDSETEPDQASMGDPTWVVETNQTVTIELHGSAADGAALADQLDQLELEAEAALAPLVLSAPLEKLEPVSTTLETSVETDQVTGVRILTWSALWRHTLGAADTPEA